MTLQEQIMKALHVQPVIDPKVEIRKRVDFLKDYVKKQVRKDLYLELAAAQDSTLAGRLAQLAVEEIRNEGGNVTFIAVRLPYKVQKDEDDAQLALQFIQADQSTAFDIASTVDAFSNQYENLLGESLTDFNKGNVKARIRMDYTICNWWTKRSTCYRNRSCCRSCNRILYKNSEMVVQIYYH